MQENGTIGEGNEHAELRRSRFIHQDISAADRQRWKHLDAAIRSWWDKDLHRATEEDVNTASCAERSLLLLPFPYVTPGGFEGTFEAMFSWDTYFINCGLLVHGRLDLVRNHILNYLFMVERYGHMPNANNAAGLTRSQTPIFPESIWRYYLASNDLDMLYRAYPLLKKEYRCYWTAAHHATPTGLATNRDLDDPSLPPELAAEAETGLDWTPIFRGDVRRCIPLITNCTLVQYAHVLALIGREVGRSTEAAAFADEANTRAQLIRKYCWNEETGLFHEYDYVAGERLDYVSACAYWPLWAGVASDEQARRLVNNLQVLEQRFGLASTDKTYPDPRPPSDYSKIADEQADAKMIGGLGQLQWMYPAGWAPEQLIAIEGLDAYGYTEAAERIACRFLTLLLDQYRKTGKLWEKYNVVDGSIVLPNSRYGNMPMHGWTAAAVAILGQRLLIRRHRGESSKKLSSLF